MSSRYDILDRKYDIDKHSCRASACVYPCPELPKLRAAMYDVAGKWGIEPGDDARQRDQFNERTQTGAST